MNDYYADCSYWQGAIDYPLLISKTAGVIIRAGFGVTEDLNFRDNAAGLEDHPGELGAYWYVTDETNGQWQAEAFASVVRENEYMFDFIVADCEDGSLGLSQSAMRARYKLFLDTLAFEFGDYKPDDFRIYTRASFWNPVIGIAGWEQNYRLWVAHYGVETPAVPTAWNGVWWLHQFSADGNNKGAEYGVESDDIDLNKLNPEFYPPPPPDPIPPAALPRMEVVNAFGLNVRSGPAVSFPKVADALAYRDVIAVEAVHSTSPSSVWARHSEGWSAVVHAGTVYLQEKL